MSSSGAPPPEVPRESLPGQRRKSTVQTREAWKSLVLKRQTKIKPLLNSDRLRNSSGWNIKHVHLLCYAFLSRDKQGLHKNIPHPLPSRRSFYSTLRKSKRNYTFLHCPFACGWVAKALFFYERIHAHALAHKLAFTVAVLIW